MAEQPLLSIVITSYTVERLNDIYELLDSIKAQTYPNIETIFVAERSRELYDQIKAYANENGILNIKVIFNEGEQGASAARNLGMKEAQGEIIGFIDDDALLFPEWGEELVKTYEDSSIVGVTGPIFPLSKDESIDWFPTEFDWIFGCAQWLDCIEMREVRNVNGTNASFRRNALNIAGPYSVVLGPPKSERGEWSALGEEAELSLRVRRKTGKRIVYNPKIRVYHKVSSNKLKLGFISQRAYQVGGTRRMLKTLDTSTSASKDLLNTEHQLLKRIITKLFPAILRGFFNNPIIAWRKLRVTIIALTFVTLGYYSYLFPSPLNRQRVATKFISRGGH